MTKGRKRRPRWAIVTATYPGGRTFMHCVGNSLRERDGLVDLLVTYRVGGAITTVEEVDTATMRRLVALKDAVERGGSPCPTTASN